MRAQGHFAHKMTILGAALAGLIGVTLGVFGSGGSVLTVPVLVYVLGLEVREAVASSLAIIGFTSLFGSLFYWRTGQVALRIALRFAPIAMATGYVAARVAAAYLSAAVQLGTLAIAVVVALTLLGREVVSGIHAADSLAVRLGPGRDDAAKPTALIAACAVAVGAFGGIGGVGGGFLVIPVLVSLLRLPFRTAVGTALLIMSANALAAFAGYVGQIPIDWQTIAAFVGFACAGLFVGATLSRRVKTITFGRTRPADAPADRRRGERRRPLIEVGYGAGTDQRLPMEPLEYRSPALERRQGDRRRRAGGR